jgi:hypothetical protein
MAELVNTIRVMKECKNCDYFGLFRSNDGRSLKRYGTCKHPTKIKMRLFRKWGVHESLYCKYYTKKRSHEVVS